MSTVTTIAGLMASIPAIRRMRGFRMYTANGRRFLDLGQEGGRACLGAKPEGLGRDVKECVDRGLLARSPASERFALEAACKRLFPSHPFLRIYSSEERAAEAGRTLSGEAPFDPVSRANAFGAKPSGRPSFVVARAFPRDAPSFEPVEGARALLVHAACPSAFPLGVLALRDEADAQSLPGDCVAGLCLRAHASTCFRAIDTLWPTGSPKRVHAAPDFEAHWARVDRRLSGIFERKGPWLHPRCPEADYPRLFSLLLEANIVASPDWAFPSVVPLEFDDGELAAASKIAL